MMLNPAAAAAGDLAQGMQQPPYSSLGGLLDEQFNTPGLLPSGYASSPLATMTGGMLALGSPAGSGLPFNMQQQQQMMLSQMSIPGSTTGSISSLGDADLRQLWQAVTRVEPGQTGSQVLMHSPTPAVLTHRNVQK